MKTTTYHKLVRDLIPEIIEKDGKRAVTETLTDELYRKALNEKLKEEVNEFLEKGSIEELADIGEVMHAIMAYEGIALEEFQRVRMEKLQNRGGFQQKILLREVIEE